MVDADTPVDYDGEELTLAKYQNFYNYYPMLDENGKLHMVKRFRGWH